MSCTHGKMKIRKKLIQSTKKSGIAKSSLKRRLLLKISIDQTIMAMEGKKMRLLIKFHIIIALRDLSMNSKL